MDYLGKTGASKDIVNTESLEAWVNTNLFDPENPTKLLPSIMPATVDEIIEGVMNEGLTQFTVDGTVITPRKDRIYVDVSTNPKTSNKTYRWGGSAYVEISPSLALGETSSTAYAGNKGKANADAITALQGRMSSAEGNFANYLPLTGGTLNNGTNSIQLAFNNGSTTLGDVGCYNAADYVVDMAIVNRQTTKFLVVGDSLNSNELTYGAAYSGNRSIVYHSGNSNKSDVDWSCSTLNAHNGVVGYQNDNSEYYINNSIVSGIGRIYAYRTSYGYQTLYLGSYEGSVGMTILGGGNVGIGTNSPSAKLDVVGASDWSARIVSNNSITYLSHNSGSGIFIGSKQSSSDYYLIDARYGQENLGGGGTSAFYVRADGNVGIGTTTPAYKLDVHGALSTKSVGLKYNDVAVSSGGAGWYRVFTSSANDAVGGNTILFINHSYYYSETEAYVLSVSRGYGNKVQFTQLSGNSVTEQQITKARMAYNATNEIWYIDIYITASVTINTYYCNGIGNGTFQTPTKVTTEPTQSVEFALTTGMSVSSDLYVNGTIHATGGIYSDSYVSAGGQNSSAPSGNANVQPIDSIAATIPSGQTKVTVTKTNPITNKRNVIVVVYDSNNQQVLADVTVSSDGSTISFGFTKSGTYRAVVIG